jgi:malic enzyme
MKIVHLDIRVVVNESDSRWNDPLVEERISVSIPSIMVGKDEGVGLAVAELVKELEKRFPEVVLEHEAEKARQAAENAEKKEE